MNPPPSRGWRAGAWALTLALAWALAGCLTPPPPQAPTLRQAGLVPSRWPPPLRPPARIRVPADCADIQTAINQLPPEGGAVLVRAGCYRLARGLRITRSHVTLRGEPGVILRLGAGVDQPVLLCGSEAEIPAEMIEDLRVEDLEIDGNQTAQTSETDPTRPWLRNSGLDVRAVDGLRVSGVRIHDCRSGGLVVSWGSSRLYVAGAAFDRNVFDGIALYASRDCRLEDFSCRANGAAGISLDNKLAGIHFARGWIEANGDVGLFARDAQDLTFLDLRISRNASHGVFLSHQHPGTDTGVKRLRFIDCVFRDNGGSGFWLASSAADSPGTVLTNAVFSGNRAGAFQFAPGAQLRDNGQPRP